MNLSKKTVRTFAELADYAAARGAQSLRRNDPIAWAYWRETASWALDYRGKDYIFGSPDQAAAAARSFVGFATQSLSIGSSPMRAALDYSRAKWIVILSRNRGLKMPPERTHVKLDWIRKPIEEDGHDRSRAAATAGGKSPNPAAGRPQG